MLSTQIAELVSRLETAADDSKQRWWANYVKGALFLGVPMAQGGMLEDSGDQERIVHHQSTHLSVSW